MLLTVSTGKLRDSIIGLFHRVASPTKEAGDYIKMDLAMSSLQSKFLLIFLTGLIYMVVTTNASKITGKFRCTDSLKDKNGDMTCSTTDLPTVTFGYFHCLSKPDVPMGEACVFTCNDGFYPASADLSVCEPGTSNQGGQWSVGNFACLAITCSTINLPTVKDGSFDCPFNADVTLGEACSFTCNDGFYPAPSDHSVCQALPGDVEGTWSLGNFACLAITCSTINLPTVKNGSFDCPFNADLTLGDTCSFTCNDGFYPASSDQSVCQALSGDVEGTWSVGNFACLAINCSTMNLRTVINGSFDCPSNVDVPVGEICSFTCNNGFYPASSDQSVCEAGPSDGEGHWSFGNFTCLAITCSTMNLRTVINGSFDCPPNVDVPTGEVCSFTCNNGFYPASSDQSVCQAGPFDQTGNWTVGNFTCLAITCSTMNLWTVTDGLFDCPSNVDVPMGDACSFTCNNGFYPASSDQSVCEAGTSDDEGQWSSGNFACLAITCSTMNLRTVVNGSFDCPSNVDVPIGEVCSFTCDNGFYPASSDQSVCEAGPSDDEGHWSFGNFTCLAITCSTMNLRTVTDGSFDCPSNVDVPIGEVCSFTCNNGFYPASSDQSVCEAGTPDDEGQWSSGNFACLAITCSTMNLRTVINGSFDCPSNVDVPIGEVCSFTCNDGFYSASSDQSVCQAGPSDETGHWTVGNFTCLAVKCPTANLPAVEDGFFDCPLNLEKSKGDVCNVICDEGFYQISSDKAECEAGTAYGKGVWSEGNFSCHVLNCDEWIEWNRNEYKFTSTEDDWEDSQRLCKNDGANLVTIEDQEENRFVFEGMLKCIQSSNFRGAWIGFNDLRQEGTWEWINGTDSTYINWRDDEPNGGTNSNCGLIYKSTGIWRDFTCSYPLSAVCERNKL